MEEEKNIAGQDSSADKPADNNDGNTAMPADEAERSLTESTENE